MLKNKARVLTTNEDGIESVVLGRTLSYTHANTVRVWEAEKENAVSVVDALCQSACGQKGRRNFEAGRVSRLD